MSVSLRQQSSGEHPVAPAGQVPPSDSGLAAAARIAAYYCIAADARQLQHDLGLVGRPVCLEHVMRAGTLAGLRTRHLSAPNEKRLKRAPMPLILALKDGTFSLLAGVDTAGNYRLVDPVSQATRILARDPFLAEWAGDAILVARRRGVGVEPRSFGFGWFLPSLWRYRRPIAHILVASLFVQLFALVTPLFFQVVVDKVLTHKGTATLDVIVAGLVGLGLGLFNVVLQYLRTYALSHTTNRIDVELGARLFHHLMRLPLGYFETRAAGQTVARMRELESIRSFLTGQGLSAVIDLCFALVFVAVLFAYSWFLALVAIASAPVYALIAALIRPLLRDKIKEKFNRGAASQQFLVEAVVGVQTIKAAAIEPMMQVTWEERLAAYVKTSFEASQLGALG